MIDLLNVSYYYHSTNKYIVLTPIFSKYLTCIKVNIEINFYVMHFHNFNRKINIIIIQFIVFKNYLMH
jgi:hypothetical protein